MAVCFAFPDKIEIRAGSTFVQGTPAGIKVYLSGVEIPVDNLVLSIKNDSPLKMELRFETKEGLYEERMVEEERSKANSDQDASGTGITEEKTQCDS